LLMACGSDPTSVPPEPHAPEIGFRRFEFTVRHPVDGVEKDVRYRGSLWVNETSEEQIVGNTLPIEAGALLPFAVNWDGTAYPVVYTRPAYAATVRLSARAESCTASVQRTAAPG